MYLIDNCVSFMVSWQKTMLLNNQMASKGVMYIMELFDQDTRSFYSWEQFLSLYGVTNFLQYWIILNMARLKWKTILQVWNSSDSNPAAIHYISEQLITLTSARVYSYQMSSGEFIYNVYERLWGIRTYCY